MLMCQVQNVGLRSLNHRLKAVNFPTWIQHVTLQTYAVCLLILNFYYYLYPILFFTYLLLFSPPLTEHFSFYLHPKKMKVLTSFYSSSVFRVNSMLLHSPLFDLVFYIHFLEWGTFIFAISPYVRRVLSMLDTKK